MSIFGEGNTIDGILSGLQIDAIASNKQPDDFIVRKQERKKARKMIAEIVEKHYKRKGSK